MTLRFSPESSKIGIHAFQIFEELLAKKDVVSSRELVYTADQIPTQALAMLGEYLRSHGAFSSLKAESEEMRALKNLSSNVVLFLLGGRVSLSSLIVACCLPSRNELLEAVLSDGHQSDRPFLVWIFGTAIAELNMWRFISVSLLRQIHVRNTSFKGEDCTVLEMVCSSLPYDGFRWTSKPGTDAFREEFRRWMINVGLPKYQMYWALNSDFVFDGKTNIFPTMFAIKPINFSRSEVSDVSTSSAQKLRSISPEFPCLFISSQVGQSNRSMMNLKSGRGHICTERMTYSIPISTLPHFVVLIKMSKPHVSLRKVKSEVEGLSDMYSIVQSESSLICLPLRINPQDVSGKDVSITFTIDFDPGMSDLEELMSTTVEYVQIWKIPSLN